MTRKRMPFFTVASVLAPVLAAALATPAAAQSNDGANNVNDIIVTARRVEERLQDVPISITVYNQEQLTTRNVADVSDLATYTPSFNVNNGTGAQNTSYSLRGFTQDQGTQPSVGVYFADVVAPRAAANQFTVGDGNGPGSFMDLENVQVLKGPQGTLFGRNTTGGAILLVPKKPTGDFEGYIEGSYGNHDMVRVQGAVNVPLSDVARLRIAAEYHDREGYLHNYSGIGPDSYNDVGYYALRASLVVDLTPDLENYTIVTFARASQVGNVGKLIRGGTGSPYGAMANAGLARAAAAGRGFFDVFSAFANPNSRLTQWQIINTTTWAASDNLTLKNIISYGQMKQDLVSPSFGADFDAHDLNPLLPVGSYIYFAGSGKFPDGNTANQSTFSNELRLQGTALDNRLDWQGGIYVELSDPLGTSAIVSPLNVRCEDTVFVCRNPLGFGATTVTANRTKFRNYGIYAQASYDVTDQITLTGGIRYTHDTVSGTGYNFRYSFPAGTGLQPANPPTCVYPNQVLPDCSAGNVRQVSKAPTWLLGVDFKPIDDLLLYAKWVRGFRAGNLLLGLPEQFSSIDPEKLDMYEVGGKASFSGAVSGNFNVAAFYNDFSNQQAAVSFTAVQPGYPPKTGSINLGKSRIYGLEIESSLSYAGLTLTGGYSYLNTKVKEVSLPTLPANSPYAVATSLFPGDRLTFVPTHKLTLGASYRLPLPDSVGTVSFGGIFTYTSDQVATYAVRQANGAPNIDGVLASRQIVDFNMSWKKIAGSSFDLSAFVNNAFNEKYYTYTLIIPGTPAGASQTTFAQIGTARLYGVRLKYSW